MSLAQVKKDDDKQKEMMKHIDLISSNEVKSQVELNMNIKKQLEQNKRNKSKVRVYEEVME